MTETNQSTKLNDRKSHILSAVVGTYIETSSAVGSSNIAQHLNFKISPATIRSEMAQLESDGYLVQPHISSGRIPSDKGYRYFVDNLIPNDQLVMTEKKKVIDFFSSTHLALEELLHETSNLLSNLTGQISFVVGTPPDTTTIKAFQLVSLDKKTALMIVVLSSGDVEKNEVIFTDDISQTDLNKIQSYFQKQLLNKSIKSLSNYTSLTEILGINQTFISSTVNAIKEVDSRVNGNLPEHVCYGGISNIGTTLKEIKDVSNFLKIIEEQITIVSLIKNLLDKDVNVSIGQENGMEALCQCAIITAPYSIDGKKAGSVSIIGPTRMRYSQAMATVSTISQTLSESLNLRGTSVNGD
jgi:heat-inducible transcriptional repressor